MWSKILEDFKNYSGNGLAVALFAAAFLYLLFTEKDKAKRTVLLYVPFVTVVLFFCPLFANIIFGYLDEETYYRILWLVPMTVVIAYAGIRLIGNLKQAWMKGLAFLLACGLIICTGDYVYDNPYFAPAENRFHVPQTVALVCDAIIVEGREVRAAVPSEMLPYVRQYTANICLPYGREIMMDGWSDGIPFFVAMEAETVDCETVARMAAEQECHYVILHETKPLKGTFEENGYHYVETVAGYRIYLQDGAYLGLWDGQA